ncbi:ABC transporter permease [Nocardioides dubius]|uniref:ABC transporter permease n=1 Tax=Nocardioides dubius TaxID=317019 RepID=A0ABN1TVV7_9ACTN
MIGSRLDIRPSQMGVRQWASECVAALVARPGRSALTALGVFLGVGTFVTVVGLANTASGQIDARFDALAATTVSATDARRSADAAFPFGEESEHRVRQLNGVVAAGVYWHLPVSGEQVHASPTGDRMGVEVYAVSAGAWKVTAPRVRSGRVYDEFADRHRERVVVLGAAVARRLGITTLATRPSVSIQGTSFTVVGIIDGAARNPELLLAVAVPRGTALALWGAPTPRTAATLQVATQVGAAVQVSEEVRAAAAPAQIEDLAVTPPPDPRRLRDGVGGDLQGLLIGLALVCLFVGAVGIANTTLVAVVERTSEIGLRRALGARRHHIAAQVMGESAVLGGIGGLIGTSVGIVIVLVVSVSRNWTALMPSELVFASPLIGVVVGAAAGLYPAARSAQIEPTEALRR